MRISDWSSDVCSSDLGCPQVIRIEPERQMALSVEAVGGDRYCGLWISAASCGNRCRCLSAVAQHSKTLLLGQSHADTMHRYWRLSQEIGRASCRERVCQYVYISVVAISLTKKSDNAHYTKKQHKET